MGAQWTLLNGSTLSFHINAYAENEQGEEGEHEEAVAGRSSDSHFNLIRVSV